jgi:hypothetical protein
MIRVTDLSNHGWILIVLGVAMYAFRIVYDTLMTVINGSILIIAGLAVIYGRSKDPSGMSCQICSADLHECKLGYKTTALPLVLPIIILIITPLIAGETDPSNEWVDFAVGERFYDEIPEDRICTNVFELVNFGEKYDEKFVEINGSILQRRSDGFQIHQYVPLCSCCPPVEVTIWAYFQVRPNPQHQYIVENAELGKEELYLFIGHFFYDEAANNGVIVLIHIEPLSEA